MKFYKNRFNFFSLCLSLFLFSFSTGDSQESDLSNLAASLEKAASTFGQLDPADFDQHFTHHINFDKQTPNEVSFIFESKRDQVVVRFIVTVKGTQSGEQSVVSRFQFAGDSFQMLRAVATKFQEERCKVEAESKPIDQELCKILEEAKSINSMVQYAALAKRYAIATKKDWILPQIASLNDEKIAKEGIRIQSHDVISSIVTLTQTDFSLELHSKNRGIFAPLLQLYFVNIDVEKARSIIDDYDALLTDMLSVK